MGRPRRPRHEEAAGHVGVILIYSYLALWLAHGPGHKPSYEKPSQFLPRTTRERQLSGDELGTFVGLTRLGSVLPGQRQGSASVYSRKAGLGQRI